MENLKYGINDKPTLVKTIPLAFQHVLSAFAGTLSGALMLATGMGMNSQDTALVVQCAMLICAVATIIQSVGIGPLGARLPIVTGGSYTLIAPMVALSKDMPIGTVFGSSFVAAIALTVLGPLAVKYLHRFFSPVVTGSAVLAVGMCLMGSAFSYMVNNSADPANEPQIWLFVGIALFTLVLTLVLDSFTKGFVQSCSILIAIVVGYVLCVVLGLVDFASVGTASWLALPKPVNFGFGLTSAPSSPCASCTSPPLWRTSATPPAWSPAWRTACPPRKSSCAPSAATAWAVCLPPCSTACP